MAGLRLERLCKGWDFPVIDRLDLDVPEGEFFVIVGPSGIGKTTLLRLVAGLERPDAGRVRVGGDDVTALPPYRRRVAMTFESYALYPHLTVFENIASPLRARRESADAIRRRVGEVAELLRISALLDRRPGEISGGQKQRTALGRTLVADPRVFLLDEPLSHLDARIRHELRQQFHELEALRAVATLYVTHDYAEALSLGDRIGVMSYGGLAQVGDAREMFLRPHNLFVAQHLGQPSINVIPAALSREPELCVCAPGLQLPVAAAHRAALERYAGSGGAVTLGIRPQHVRVLAAGAEPEPSGPPATTTATLARVDLFEALGASGVLIAELGDQRLTALTDPELRAAHGESVQLAFEHESFLYFDPQDGRNLLL